MSQKPPDALETRGPRPVQAGGDPVLRPRRPLVLGAGLSGLAAARLLAALGAEVTVSDRLGAEVPTRAELAALGAALISETEALAAPLAADLLVVSPGAPDRHPLAERARAAGVKVVGEMELAARHLAVDFVGVTGTNGKTTTTSLIGHILAGLGVEAFVGGNIGNPLSNLALRALGGEAPRGPAVLEVSSFQLETLDRMVFGHAALLNLTPDHLDRHGTMESYLEVKSRIFQNPDPGAGRVANLDDGPVRRAAEANPGRPRLFSRSRRPDRGAWVDGGHVEVVEGAKVLAREPWAAFELQGVHNQENVMAAVLIVQSLGFDPAAALGLAMGFRPSDHRLETVAEFQGVKYIDDSKGTNVGAVAMALESLAGPVVLIMGGRDKGLDFGWLEGAVRGKVKRLVLMGECRDKIRAALGRAAPTVMAADMVQAVRLAGAAAEAGDCVLLSPGTASFDMFKDYRERGRVFQGEVLAMIRERGEDRS